MPSIREAKAGPYNFMGLFIGRPGKGKSVAAASFPEPIYIFDLDGRINAVSNAFGDREIDFDTYNFDEFVRMHQKLSQLMLNCKYKTVIVDSYTAFADMMLHYSLSLRGGTGGVQKGVISMNTIEDYNAETQGIQKLIYMLRTCPAPYKIMTAHMLLTEYYDITNKQTRILKSVLTAGKKVSEKVPGYFDEVWHFYTKDNATVSAGPKFVMRPLPLEDDNAKTALPLPMEVEFTKGPNNPRGSLYEAIKKQLAGKDAAPNF
jgi:hypothetical protein